MKSRKSIFWLSIAVCSMTGISCCARKSDVQVAKEIDNLGHSNVNICLKAIHNLGEMRDRAIPAIPILIRMLGDQREVHSRRHDGNMVTVTVDRTSIGEEAARALAKIGQPAVQSLVNRVSDEDWHTRWNATKALRSIKDERSVMPLAALLKDGDWRVRREASLALSEIKDARAVPSLIAALKDEHREVRENAAEALGNIRAPEAVEPLIAALRDDEWGVRGRAARALGRIKDSKAVTPLVAAMTSWVVSRDIPASALGDIGDGSAVAPLIAAMSSGDEKVRASAAEALGKIADPRSIEPLVGSLYDTCGDVREKAGIALAQIREAALAPLIGVVMDQRPDNAMINRSTARAAAVKALGETRDARAVGPLMNALRDKDGPVREEATNALAKIGGPAVKPLMTDLADAKLDVRMQAVSTLAKIGQPAVEPLIDVLKGDDQIAAAYAAKALGEIKDPRAMAFLSAVQNHSNPVVRKAVAEALNNMR